jgi:predicted short-subunit dehydrogenase-like oxidoreductase (DUF2520 family)
MKVVVVGRGKVGRALARELEERGVTVELERGRSVATHADRRKRVAAEQAASEHDTILYLIAVPDAALADVAHGLAGRVKKRDVVLHCAGARGVEELKACADAGAATGVLHPLVSFASSRSFPRLAGATFVAQGSVRALRAGRWLCKQLAARCLTAPVIGPAYHAAAALLANGSAALAYSAQRVLVELGVPKRAAEHALAGLLSTVAANVAQVGVPTALTGPVARGDAASVRAHLRALAKLSPELALPYRQVQPIIQACAQALHASQAQAKRRDQRQR